MLLPPLSLPQGSHRKMSLFDLGWWPCYWVLIFVGCKRGLVMIFSSNLSRMIDIVHHHCLCSILEVMLTLSFISWRLCNRRLLKTLWQKEISPFATICSTLFNNITLIYCDCSNFGQFVFNSCKGVNWFVVCGKGLKII